MSDVTTNPGVVNVQEQPEQVAQAAQLSAEQQADSPGRGQEGAGPGRQGPAERQPRERRVPVPGRPARPAVHQPLPQGRQGAGLRHRRAGADLSWWLGKNVDANLILRTYAAINLLHGDIMPPPSGAKAEERNAWAELVDRLPPVGHFHKAWSQLVERVDDGIEERWVLLPGFEEQCTTLYQDVPDQGHQAGGRDGRGQGRWRRAS